MKLYSNRRQMRQCIYPDTLQPGRSYAQAPEKWRQCGWSYQTRLVAVVPGSCKPEDWECIRLDPVLGRFHCPQCWYWRTGGRRPLAEDDRSMTGKHWLQLGVHCVVTTPLNKQTTITCVTAMDRHDKAPSLAVDSCGSQSTMDNSAARTCLVVSNSLALARGVAYSETVRCTTDRETNNIIA